MSHFKYIVLGGGNASGYAARQFVKLGGAKGELAIITDEQFVSYERPALSKAYLFPENPARLPGFHACVGVGGDRQDESWYEAHGITYLTETKVTGLDVKSKMLLTQHGTKLGYDKLVVATGARVSFWLDAVDHSQGPCHSLSGPCMHLVCCPKLDIDNIL